MNIIWICLGAYFGLGILALAILEVATGRVHRKLRPAASDAQQQLIEQGTVVGGKEALLLTLLALWLFWPTVVYAALRSVGGTDGQEG